MRKKKTNNSQPKDQGPIKKYYVRTQHTKQDFFSMKDFIILTFFSQPVVRHLGRGIVRKIVEKSYQCGTTLSFRYSREPFKKSQCGKSFSVIVKKENCNLKD